MKLKKNHKISNKVKLVGQAGANGLNVLCHVDLGLRRDLDFAENAKRLKMAAAIQIMLNPKTQYGLSDIRKYVRKTVDQKRDLVLWAPAYRFQMVFGKVGKIHLS